jgi:hypothetical protein
MLLNVPTPHDSHPVFKLVGTLPAEQYLQTNEPEASEYVFDAQGLQTSLPPTLYVEARQTSQELLADEAFLPTPQYLQDEEPVFGDT